MTQNDIKYWLALKRIEKVGNVGFNNLVGTFGSPRAVFDASISSLKTIPRITQKTASDIKSFDKWVTIEKEIELASQVECLNNHLRFNVLPADAFEYL